MKYKLRRRRCSLDGLSLRPSLARTWPASDGELFSGTAPLFQMIQVFHDDDVRDVHDRFLYDELCGKYRNPGADSLP